MIAQQRKKKRLSAVGLFLLSLGNRRNAFMLLLVVALLAMSALVVLPQRFLVKVPVFGPLVSAGQEEIIGGRSLLTPEEQGSISLFDRFYARMSGKIIGSRLVGPNGAPLFVASVDGGKQPAQLNDASGSAGGSNVRYGLGGNGAASNGLTLARSDRSNWRQRAICL